MRKIRIEAVEQNATRKGMKSNTYSLSYSVARRSAGYPRGEKKNALFHHSKYDLVALRIAPSVKLEIF